MRTIKNNSYNGYKIGEKVLLLKFPEIEGEDNIKDLDI